MTGLLAWVGRQARWVLLAGIVAAFLLPALSAALRPLLPALVSVVLGLAMARIDLIAVAQEAVRPWALARLIAAAVAMLPVTAALYLGLARLAGLGPALESALVYLAAAPPIASAAGLAFMLGLDGRRALELTVGTTILTPILGPLTVAWLLPGAPGPGPAALALSLGAMIAGAVVVGVTVRRLLGPARIAARTEAFDGVQALALWLFVVPLFDGVPPLLLADPARGGLVLGVACLFNLGVNALVRLAARRVSDPAAAGAWGLVWGNRTVAMYLAVLPFDPGFAVFVALYQVPMLLTPLVFGRRKGLADRPV